MVTESSALSKEGEKKKGVNYLDMLVDRLNKCCDSQKGGCDDCSNLTSCRKWFDGLTAKSGIDSRTYVQATSVISRFKTSR